MAGFTIVALINDNLKVLLPLPISSRHRLIAVRDMKRKKCLQFVKEEKKLISKSKQTTRILQRKGASLRKHVLNAITTQLRRCH